MQSQKRFSSYIFWATLGMQILLTAFFATLLYSINSVHIAEGFNSRLNYESKRLATTIDRLHSSVLTISDHLAATPALHAALSQNNAAEVDKILAHANKLLPPGSSFYLRLAGSDRICPPDPGNPLLHRLTPPSDEILQQNQPRMFTESRRLYALLYRPLAGSNNRLLGELYLLCGLCDTSYWNPRISSQNELEPPLLLAGLNREWFDIQNGNPVNIRAEEFKSRYSLRELPNLFGADLAYAQPVSWMRNNTQDLFWHLILFVVAVFAATTPVALLLRRLHNAAFNNLLRQADALARGERDGDLDTSRLLFREFAETGASFNLVLRHLRDSRDEIRRFNAELEERVKTRTAELTSANRDLAQSRQQLQHIVEYVPCAACLFDARLQPLVWSHMWEELFRLSVPHNHDKHFLELMPEYRDYWEKVFGDCLAGNVRHCTEKRMLVHGREYWLRWEAHPWGDWGSGQTVRGIILFIEDVTSQKWSAEALRRAVEEAENSSRLKSEFLANVSHEIRTPLNCIIGFAEIIAESGSITDIKAHADLILSESDALLTLINDLLDFSKIEAGKLETESLDFDLQRVISDIGPGVRLRLRKKNVEFTTEVDPSVPRYLHGDAFRVRQVVLNLVHNSVKFTDKGHIKVRVTLSAPLPGGVKLRFTVEDTGIGIPLDKQKRIFEKFTQADGSTTRKYGGTGLGTAISKKLVEIMGGSIGFKSTPGKGSVFWFELPFTPGEEPEEDLSAGATTQQNQHNSAVCRILLAEDYLPNQMVARTHLENAGFQVEIANNGKEACEMTQQTKFALILMDLSMPEMDGFEATERIRRQHGSGDGLPIIALTASAEPSVRARCLSTGFDDIISKPIRKNDLIGTVRKWLLRTESLAATEERTRPVSARAESVNSLSPCPLPLPQSSACEEPAEQVPPIDFEALLEDYPGKEALINRLLLQFTLLLDEQINTLQRAIETEDVLALRDESHKLIGGAGTLRVNNIFESAKEINAAAKERDFDRCRKEVGRILRQKTEIERLLAERRTAE